MPKKTTSPEEKRIHELEAALRKSESSLLLHKDKVAELIKEVEDFNRGWDLVEAKKKPLDNDNDSVWNGFMAGSYSIFVEELKTLKSSLVASFSKRKILEELAEKASSLSIELNEERIKSHGLQGLVKLREEELLTTKNSSAELLSLVMSSSSEVSRLASKVEELDAELNASKYQASSLKKLVEQYFKDTVHLSNIIDFLKKSNCGAKDLSEIIGEPLPVAELIWDLLERKT